MTIGVGNEWDPGDRPEPGGVKSKGKETQLMATKGTKKGTKTSLKKVVKKSVKRSIKH